MANNINFGKIYDSTWWGVGVTSNNIKWGIIYKNLANPYNAITTAFNTRVTNEGFTVESLDCVNDITNTFIYNAITEEFYQRVTNEGFTVEALDCVNEITNTFN